MRAAVATLAAIALTLGAGAGSGTAREHQVDVIRVKLCTPAEVASTVSRFIAAFNAGNIRRLDRVLARKPFFRWYSTDAPGQRFLPVAADRTSLLWSMGRRT